MNPPECWNPLLKEPRVRIALVLTVFTFLFLPALPAFGQSTATLTGTVTDASAAVISGTQIQCLNSGTGLAYNTVTNDQGIFRFADLPIGTYDLTITKPGFKTSNERGISLATGHTVDIPIRLETGGATQTVEVRSTAQEVQPSSSEIQTTIENKSMQDLPLNGRNPLQLVGLAPGVLYSASTPSFQTANSEVAVNGNRGSDNDYLLDGVNYTDVHYGTAPVLPSPDALQEFTIKTSNFTASESGAGAVVQYTTKSGTNQFHGSLFEYLRNNDFDARNYFSQTVTPFKRNQFGGVLGGPVLRNRAFFFLSYQGTRTVGGASPSVAQVPSLAFRAGNFSGSANKIIDPTTKLPFASNTIPSTRFDAGTAKLLSYIPQPNQSNGTYISNPRSNQNDDQFLGRLDEQLTAKDHLTGRYFYDDFKFQQQPSALPNFYGLAYFINWNVIAADTHTFSPNLLMISTFGFTTVGSHAASVQPVTAQDVGANVVNALLGAPEQTVITISTYAALSSSAYDKYLPKSFEYKTRAAWEHGTHMVQFGIDVIRNDEWALGLADAYGAWTFNGSRTMSSSVTGSGNPFADFLLGLPVTFTQNAKSPQNIYETKIQPWFQDDWKIRPRFTLNLGLRWEPWLPATDRLAPQVGFEAGVQSTVAPLAPLGLVFSGDNGLPHAIFSRDMNNVAPRVGFAWDVAGNARTVLRGAYGIFYRPQPLNLQRFSGNTAAFRSLSVSISDPSSFENPYSTPGATPNPFPWTVPTESSLKSYAFALPVTTSALIPHSKTSYVQEWNLTAERQLLRDLAVSAAYVGNHMVKGMDSTEGNPAVYIPGASTEANVNSRRVYKGLASLQTVAPFQFSNYNALQLSVTKHAENGLTVIGNYSWSKCMDNDTQTEGSVSVINKFNINADYAVCDGSVGQLANISLVYDLPSIARFHGFGDKALNHWQVSTITLLESGSPFSISSGVDNSLSGPTTNSGTNDLADRIPGVSPQRPAGASRIAEYFNPKAYSENALGTFGNSGRNSMISPGVWTSDVALFKNIPIKENLRMTMRFEAYNAVNHTNLSNPTSTFTSASFGQILTAGSPRVLQLSMRLAF